MPHHGLRKPSPNNTRSCSLCIRSNWLKDTQNRTLFHLWCRNRILSFDTNQLKAHQVRYPFLHGRLQHHRSQQSQFNAPVLAPSCSSASLPCWGAPIEPGPGAGATWDISVLFCIPHTSKKKACLHGQRSTGVISYCIWATHLHHLPWYACSEEQNWMEKVQLKEFCCRLHILSKTQTMPQSLKKEQRKWCFYRTAWSWTLKPHAAERLKDSPF